MSHMDVASFPKVVSRLYTPPDFTIFVNIIQHITNTALIKWIDYSAGKVKLIQQHNHKDGYRQEYSKV